MALVVSAQVAVLQELARGPSWTDGLRKRIGERTGGEVELSRGNVTPAIEALLAAGHIEEAGEQPRGDFGGTPRRLYRITAAGLREAERQRRVMLAVMGMTGAEGESEATPKRLVELEGEE